MYLVNLDVKVYFEKLAHIQGLLTTVKLIMKLTFVNDKNYMRKNSCLASYNIFNYGKSEKLYLLKFYLAPPPKYELAPRMPPQIVRLGAATASLAGQ